MIRTFFFLVLFNSTVATAETTWINVTGIDTSLLSQNYLNFYNEARAFGEVCKKNSNRRCLNFINPDLSLMRPGYDPVVSDMNLVFNFKNDAGAPDKGKVLRSIQEALLTAGENDQVLISLANHGAPDLDGKSPSCIYLDGKEKICENEIGDLLKKYQKKGTRVLIVGDGCYSGGFNRLSSKYTCVVTTAPQKAVGYDTTADVWNTIKDSNMRKLSDLWKTSGSRAYNIRPASQFALQQQCKELRKELKAKNFDVAQIKRLNDSVGDLRSYCKVGRFDAFTMSVPAQTVMEVGFALKAMRQAGIEKLSCKYASSDLCKKMGEILKSDSSFGKMDLIFAYYLEAGQLQNEYSEKISKATEGLSDSELGMVYLENIETNAGYKKLSQDKRRIVKNANDKVLKINGDLNQRADKIYGDLEPLIKDRKFIENVAGVWPCFVSDDREEIEWNGVADKYPEKVMTQKDIEDAKACESSFSL